MYFSLFVANSSATGRIKRKMGGKSESGSAFKARVLFVKLRGSGVGSFVKKLLETERQDYISTKKNVKETFLPLGYLGLSG